MALPAGAHLALLAMLALPLAFAVRDSLRAFDVLAPSHDSEQGASHKIGTDDAGASVEADGGRDQIEVKDWVQAEQDIGSHIKSGDTGTVTSVRGDGSHVVSKATIKFNAARTRTVRWEDLDKLKILSPGRIELFDRVEARHHIGVQVKPGDAGEVIAVDAHRATIDFEAAGPSSVPAHSFDSLRVVAPGMIEEKTVQATDDIGSDLKSGDTGTVTFVYYDLASGAVTSARINFEAAASRFVLAQDFVKLAILSPGTIGPIGKGDGVRAKHDIGSDIKSGDTGTVTSVHRHGASGVVSDATIEFEAIGSSVVRAFEFDGLTILPPGTIAKERHGLGQ